MLSRFTTLLATSTFLLALTVGNVESKPGLDIFGSSFKCSGCLTDSQPRVLHYIAPTFSTPMNVSQCVGFCTNMGFALAGIEYGDECYCGNGCLHDYGPSQSCNMPCRGNPLETCGGPNSLRVYTTGVKEPTQGPATAPLLYNGYGLTLPRCWKDDTWPQGGNRTLPYRYNKIPAEEMTVYKCIDGCAAGGYGTAGLEWGQECWCGNTNTTAIGSNNASECDMPCLGDASQLCGGSNRLLTYKKTLL